MTVTIFHNPRCSKSRQTLELIRGRGAEPAIVDYLKTPPTADDLKAIVAKLGISPRDLMRKGEDAYKQRGLANPDLSDDELIAAMVAEPILIERPIVVHGEKAALGRPPETVLDIL